MTTLGNDRQGEEEVPRVDEATSEQPINGRLAQAARDVSERAARGENARYAFPSAWDVRLQVVTQTIFQQAFSERQALFFDSAVRDATVYLESKLRELTDAPTDLVGKDLAEHAFGQSGFLSDPNLPASEREGIHLLFRGATQYIRNAVGHRFTNLSADEAFGAIGVIDYLMKLAGAAARRKLIQPFVVVGLGGQLVTRVLRVDLDGDGESEVVVLCAEWSPAGTANTRIIVLDSSASRPLPGASVITVPMPVLADIRTDLDLDGDQRPEVFVSTSDGAGRYAALIVDVHDGLVRQVLDEAGEVAWSSGLPFQLVTPTAGQPTLLVGYDGETGARVWSIQDAALVREDTAAVP